jgi:hypothetical protein
MTNFLAMLQVWRQQGDRLLIFIDMNEHILNGPLAKRMQMGLEEATHQHWGDIKPHTYVGGKEPIDAVFHNPDLEVTSTLQLSFYDGVSDHRTVLVDISTWSAIGKQEFPVVHPHAWRLNSKNNSGRVKYLRYLETQMATHKMTHCLDECECPIQGYPSPPDAVKKWRLWISKWWRCNWPAKNNANQYILQTSSSANQYVLFTSGAGHTRGYWHVSSLRHRAQAILFGRR